jgi:hypothetical protein
MQRVAAVPAQQAQGGAVSVNFTRPASYIPPGRTVLYAATGSGTLTITVGSDGSPDVNVYIEYDGYLSDPIPGTAGTATPLTINFSQFLMVYADNASYTQALAPSLAVYGSVTPPPAPTVPTVTAAAPAFLDVTFLSSLMTMLMYVMFFAMFAKLIGTVMKGVGGA